MIPAREGAAEAARTKNQNQAGTGMFTRHLHTLAIIPSQPRLLVPDSSQALDYAWTRWQPSYLFGLAIRPMDRLQIQGRGCVVPAALSSAPPTQARQVKELGSRILRHVQTQGIFDTRTDVLSKNSPPSWSHPANATATALYLTGRLWRQARVAWNKS